MTFNGRLDAAGVADAAAHTCVNNYNRYLTRYRLYRSFQDQVEASSFERVFYTIEMPAWFTAL